MVIFFSGFITPTLRNLLWLLSAKRATLEPESLLLSPGRLFLLYPYSLPSWSLLSFPYQNSLHPDLEDNRIYWLKAWAQDFPGSPVQRAGFSPWLGNTKSHMLCAAAAKSLQSCLTLCDPIDSSPPGSLVPGIFQASTWCVVQPKKKKKSLGFRIRRSGLPQLTSLTLEKSLKLHRALISSPEKFSTQFTMLL